MNSLPFTILLNNGSRKHLMQHTVCSCKKKLRQAGIQSLIFTIPLHKLCCAFNCNIKCR